MKKYLALLLALITICLVGCSNNKVAEENNESSVKVYSDMAQSFVDSGDYESAIRILEEAISITNSAELKAILYDIQNSVTIETSETDIPAKETAYVVDDTLPYEETDSYYEDTEDYYDPYEDVTYYYPEENYYYNENNTSYEVDKVTVNPRYVYWDNGVLVAECFVINGYSQSVTNIDIQSFSLSNAYGEIASAAFGVLQDETLEPYTYSIWTLTFYDGISSYGADLTGYLQWSCTTQYSYVSQTQPQQQTPTSSPTTASGILANLGMTEAEFRASCQPLKMDLSSNTNIVTSDLREYPNQYIGYHFKFVTTLNNVMSIDINRKGVSDDGYTTYYRFPNQDWQGYLLFFDMRDNIYSPTISVGDDIIPYVIFNGVQTINGIDYITFLLISVDKN